MTASLESFLTGTNAQFIAELYTRYLEDPGSVDPSWVGFFGDLQEEGRAILQELRGASWAPSDAVVIGDGANGGGNGGGNGGAASPAPAPAAVPAALRARGLDAEQMRAATLDSIRALMLIRSYRVRGHLTAHFDPLGLNDNAHHPELDPKSYGFSEDDYDRPIFIDYVLGLETASLREIMRVLKATYGGTIGVEFMHMQEPDQKAWIQRRIESIHNRTQFTLRGKLAILDRLIEAEGFEHYLDRKFTGTKRFGAEGGEAVVPAIEQILKRGGQLGIREVVIGMAHRGRLNVLANVMHKPYSAIFSEFEGGVGRPADIRGSGDVKYHLGTSADREFDGNTIHLSLTANPSHLEAVDPVVLGKVRAKQTLAGDIKMGDLKKGQNQVLGLLIHGDAAFSGQGLVAECLGLSGLRGYRTGGTIHFIINNQIAFTTSPSFSRSSPYPSDVAKMIQAPIFHVNGDDPEAVVHVARIATEFRQEFNKDVIIDMYCYRRWGHNEADEPSFTQPIMYKTIAGHPTTRQIYAEQLIREGAITEDEHKKRSDEFDEMLNREFEAAEGYKPNKADWLEGKWKGLVQFSGEEELAEEKTEVSMEMLQEVGKAISSEPEDFTVNRKISRQLAAKRKMFETGEGIDWATAEALAFGTLLREGTGVRLSGQDSRRGTFSQRHCVLIDQENESQYTPLNNIHPEQAFFEVIDSPLSEASVLGFEYGYSLADPERLTLWEAQFGDFANGAQVIIDQFLAPGESKWLRMSGLVLLLPHGFEGQGPEHSSARPERYLQLCAEDNMMVVNVTTPAGYFHVLRRQMCRNFRKPLIVMSPKSLLRHKLVVSKLEEMGPGSRFRRVLPETDVLAPDDKVRRVVLCSGKVYYDLLQARRDQGIDDVALVRVEQLYPWPRQSVLTEIARYPNAEVLWCQEEPANQGAWLFVYPRLVNIVAEVRNGASQPYYVGRKAAASPATGFAKVHKAEQDSLVNQALGAEIEEIHQPFRRTTQLGMWSPAKD